MNRQRWSSAVWLGCWCLLATALPPAGSQGAELQADRLFDPANLSEVRLEIAPRDWTRLCNEAPDGSVLFGGEARPSSYTWFRADLWIDGVKIQSVGVRKKGFFGSHDVRRPSLKVSFDEYVEQEPIKGLSRLTLNNNKQDRSLVSQLLAYQLFRDAGVAAPRCGFARVTVNGQYLGIYANVESIRKPFLKRNFGSSKGNLYEGQLTDFHPLAVDRLEVKTNESKNDLADIRRLADLLAEPGALRLDELDQIIDLRQFLRYWAVESLIGFWDGYAANQNNFYLYFDPQTGKGHFIPWGADWTFTSGGPFGGFGRRAMAVYAQSILTNRLYHTAGIPERYEAAMREILTDAWDETKLLERIDRAEQLLTPHLGPAQRDAPQAMDEIREFIRGRRETVLQELARGPARVPREPRTPAHTVTVGQLAGTFDTRWGNQADGPESSSARIELTLDGTRLQLPLATSTVRAVSLPRFGFAGPGGFRRPPGDAGITGSPVAVTLIADRPAAQPLTITWTIDRDRFQAGDQPIPVRGRLIEGRPGMPGGFGRPPGPAPPGPAPPGARRPAANRNNRSLVGSVRLTKAGTEDGEPVSGEFTFQIVETRGGVFGGAGFGGAGFGGGRGPLGGGPFGRGPVERGARSGTDAPVAPGPERPEPGAEPDSSAPRRDPQGALPSERR